MLQKMSWTEDDCVRVLFSDQSRFSLDSDSRHVLSWREPESQHWPSNIIKKYHYGYGGLMIWAGIMVDKHTHLHVFN
ncbi:hypothetical protein TNCV_573621 [Trichonephila clavipes]|nr:hypothetical protein TNCV_573621 [Trichonephila clavipes]